MPFNTQNVSIPMVFLKYFEIILETSFPFHLLTLSDVHYRGLHQRKLPFTAPKTAATRKMYEEAIQASTFAVVHVDSKLHSIARNASCSPLLQMPSEMRKQFWRLVMGDRLIHFELLVGTTEQNEERWYCEHIVCQRDHPEDEVPEDDVRWQLSHQHCSFQMARKIGIRIYPGRFPSQQPTAC